MKRMGMIKGTRRSAKQVVEKYINMAILKIEVCSNVPPQVRDQLNIYRAIAKDLGWTELETKINRSLETAKGKGIFTDP